MPMNEVCFKEQFNSRLSITDGIKKSLRIFKR
jgi:hypothetical protein